MIAFTRETQQAFLEAHVAAFGFFGGVFATIRYAPGRQRAADRQLDRNNHTEVGHFQASTLGPTQTAAATSRALACGQAAFQEPAGREGRTAVRSSA